MKVEEREYNIFAGERPKVLLLGNGINRAYGGKSWDQLLDSIKDSEEYPLAAKNYIMPMPLKAAMLTNNQLAQKMRSIVKSNDSIDNHNQLQKISWRDFIDTNPQMRKHIRQTVEHFDYVLTTNYSYEIEMALLDADIVKPEQIAALMNFHEISNAQTQFLINTYNLVGTTPIWHIHGEARKPDSMIIGSAYYGKLLKRCIERIDGGTASTINENDGSIKKMPSKGKEYKRNYQSQRPQKIGSWIDAFVLGDVYILGFGLDLSESELWWLLDYKSQNKLICGQTFYFEPEKECQKTCIADSSLPCNQKASFVDERQCRNYLLEKTFHVTVRNLDVKIKTNDDYKTFYKRAAERFEVL